MHNKVIKHCSINNTAPTNEQNLNSGGKGVKDATFRKYKEAHPEASRKEWREYKKENGIQGGLSTDAQKSIASGIGNVASSFTTMNTNTNQASLAMRDSISSAAINSGNPIAMAIGAAAKVVDAIGDATGFHIDDLDKDAAKEAGVSGGAAFLNNAMNALPGNSAVMAVFSPDKTIKSNFLDENGQAILGGFADIQDDINASKKLAGKRTLFGIGRNKINRYIRRTNEKIDLLNEIGETNTLAKNSDYGTNIAQQNLNRYAGTTYNMHAVGRNGMKILSRQELQKILALRKLQKGGVIGTDTNILPEGMLHARLNHLDEINPELEDVTPKGIPVLDDKGNQVAEIEKEELIFRLELTNKIEALMKDGSEKAMIEAGKLIAEELIENTQDNTGQLTEEDENE